MAGCMVLKKQMDWRDGSQLFMWMRYIFKAGLAPIVCSVFATIYPVQKQILFFFLVIVTSLLMLRTYNSAIRRLKAMKRYACFTKHVFDNWEPG